MDEPYRYSSMVMTIVWLLVETVLAIVLAVVAVQSGSWPLGLLSIASVVFVVYGVCSLTSSRRGAR